MRRILQIVTAAVVLLMAGSAFAAPGFEVGARGAYWFPKLTGSAQTNATGDTRFDFKDTLGVKDENIPFGEAYLRLGSTTLRVGYTQFKFDGDKRLTQTVVFNGTTYSVSDDVISSLDMKMLDGDVQFDFLRPDIGIAGFNLGLILKVKYVDGKVELRDSTTTETKDFKAPIPMIGAAAGIGFLKDMVRVDARATGIAYSGNHLYDADAYASFAPLPFVRIQGGYRYIDLKIDKDGTLASFKLKGPYVGAQLSF
ncbi:MAG: porin family protein [Desulfobacteria bacterium]